MIEAGTVDARCGRIASRRRTIGWPRSLMGRISIVLMTMVLWVVFVSCWERQTSLSIWWHGGSVWGPSEEVSCPEILEHFFDWAEPVWTWLPDGRAWFDEVLVRDSVIQNVDLRDADMDHNWLTRLRRCRNLSRLELKSSQLGSQIASLGNLPNFHRIRITCDEEEVNVRFLDSLPQLKEFDIVAPSSRVLGMDALRHQSIHTVDLQIGDAGDEVLGSLANWLHLKTLYVDSKMEFSASCCERVGEIRNLDTLVIRGSFPEVAGVCQILRNDSLRLVSISGPDQIWIEKIVGDTQLKQRLEQHPRLVRLYVWEDRFIGCGCICPVCPHPKIGVFYGPEPRVKNEPQSNDD